MVLFAMESYVPFIYHLNEIALHYKRTSCIQACYQNYSNSESLKAGTTKQSLICDKDSKENVKPSVKPACLVCGKTFVSRLVLNEHMKYLHIKDQLYKCDHCSYQAFCKKHLTRHLRLRHLIRSRPQLYSCDQCSYQSVRKKDIKKHSKTHLKELKPKMEPVACCGSVFKYPSKLARHKIHCASNMVKCRICQESFVSTDALELHRSKIHQFSEGKWNCMICNKAFATNGTLTTHLHTVHIKSTVYSCSKCDSSFTRKYQLQRHWNEHHQDSAESFKCDDCGRKFLRKGWLIQHMKIHLNGHFNCLVCGRTFHSYELLMGHEAVHRPCQLCGFTFKTKKNRESHMQWHIKGNKVTTNRPKKIRVPNNEQDQEQVIRKSLKELPQNS